jgi:hypothetical protein
LSRKANFPFDSTQIRVAWVKKVEPDSILHFLRILKRPVRTFDVFLHGSAVEVGFATDGFVVSRGFVKHLTIAETIPLEM